MSENKTFTVKDMAEKAGITPAELRKLLRKEFNRAGKTTVSNKRQEYRFTTSDPIVKKIVDRAKALVRIEYKRINQNLRKRR